MKRIYSGFLIGVFVGLMLGSCGSKAVKKPKPNELNVTKKPQNTIQNNNSTVESKNQRNDEPVTPKEGNVTQNTPTPMGPNLESKAPKRPPILPPQSGLLEAVKGRDEEGVIEILKTKDIPKKEWDEALLLEMDKPENIQNPTIIKALYQYQTESPRLVFRGPLIKATEMFSAVLDKDHYSRNEHYANVEHAIDHDLNLNLIEILIKDSLDPDQRVKIFLKVIKEKREPLAKLMITKYRFQPEDLLNALKESITADTMEIFDLIIDRMIKERWTYYQVYGGVKKAVELGRMEMVKKFLNQWDFLIQHKVQLHHLAYEQNHTVLAAYLDGMISSFWRWFWGYKKPGKI